MADTAGQKRPLNTQTKQARRIHHTIAATEGHIYIILQHRQALTGWPELLTPHHTYPNVHTATGTLTHTNHMP